MPPVGTANRSPQPSLDVPDRAKSAYALNSAPAYTLLTPCVPDRQLSYRSATEPQGLVRDFRKWPPAVRTCRAMGPRDKREDDK